MKTWNLTISAVLLIGALAYAPLLKAGFLTYNDSVVVYRIDEDGPLNWEAVKKIFNSRMLETYTPLTILSYAIEEQFLGFNAVITHLDNILLHLLNAYLVYLLVLRLWFPLNGRPVAIFAALLFCLHPMHVCSVAWATLRKDVLYSAFYLASCLMWITYIRYGIGRRYIYALVFAVLSILAKPMALSLPFILFLIDWFVGRKKFHWLDKIPFMVAMWMVAAITFWADSNATVMAFTSAKSPMVWAWCFWFYPLKFIFPFSLHEFYAIPDSNWILAIAFVALGALPAIFTRRNALLWFGVLWYVLSIFFLLRGHFMMTDQVADRYMYLPSVGLCIYFAYLLNTYVHRRWLIAVLFFALFLKVWGQMPTWENSMSFYNHVLKNNTNVGNILMLRGREHYVNEEYDAALADYRRALDSRANRKDIDECYFYIGKIYVFKKDYDMAYRVFNRMRGRRDSQDFMAWNAYALLKMGRYDAALRELNKALREQDVAQNYYYRGLCNAELGHIEQARQDFTMARDLADNASDAKEAQQEIDKIGPSSRLLNYQKNLEEVVWMAQKMRDK